MADPPADSPHESTGPGPHQWAQEFAQFAADLTNAPNTADALRIILEAGRTLVAGTDLFSVTLRHRDGAFDTAATTSPLAVQLDKLQYRLDECPCLMASRRAGLGLFACSDVENDALIPRWGPAAAREQIRSVLAVGLFAHGDPPRVGSLNFMSHTRGGLDHADRDAAVVLAAHAAAVLDAHRAVDAAEAETANLHEGLRNRDIIGQAKGILMERENIDEDKAFDILKSVSQRVNVKLSSIARTIADRRTEL